MDGRNSDAELPENGGRKEQRGESPREGKERARGPWERADSTG
jgi:hypothetical protein